MIGTFNAFNADANPLTTADNGNWYAKVDDAKAGDEYKFAIKNGDQELSRIDTYVRQVTSSVANGVIYADDFDWEDDVFQHASME